MSWIIIPKEQSTQYRRRLITWYYGIDAVELKNGDFVLPERVIKGIKKFDRKFKEIELPDHSISTVDIELTKFPTQKTVIFKEITDINTI